MAETQCFTRVEITDHWEHLFRYVTKLSSLQAVGEPPLSINLPVADFCSPQKYSMINLCRQLRGLNTTFQKL